MNLVTVITPTYNRARLLPRLFESLKKQEKIFEWLIVDDGSIDNTKQVVDFFISKADFPIKYIKKRNGGKHTALNVGIREVKTELTFIVDSDDKLVPTAMCDIRIIHEKYKDYQNVGAYSFQKSELNRKAIIELAESEFIDNYIKYRIKENRPGDMAEVFKTIVLKDNKFPEFEQEKFLSEDVVWIEIAKKYDYVFVDKVIYECEYLVDGLTSNDKKMKFSSPLGSMLRGKKLMYKDCGFLVNIKGAIIYNAYMVRNSVLELNSSSYYEKILIYITKPLGYIFRYKWKR